jgi:hypothetical protein
VRARSAARSPWICLVLWRPGAAAFTLGPRFTPRSPRPEAAIDWPRGRTGAPWRPGGAERSGSRSGRAKRAGERAALSSKACSSTAKTSLTQKGFGRKCRSPSDIATSLARLAAVINTTGIWIDPRLSWR